MNKKTSLRQIVVAKCLEEEMKNEEHHIVPSKMNFGEVANLLDQKFKMHVAKALEDPDLELTGFTYGFGENAVSLSLYLKHSNGQVIEKHFDYIKEGIYKGCIFRTDPECRSYGILEEGDDANEDS